jgi:putative FmdB family regulatory protein
MELPNRSDSSRQDETMPIYEYVCKTCGHKFEALVFGGKAPICESCGSGGLERLMSLPHVQSETTKAAALRAAKRRDQAQAAERVNEQIRYEKSHND